MKSPETKQAQADRSINIQVLISVCQCSCSHATYHALATTCQIPRALLSTVNLVWATQRLASKNRRRVIRWGYSFGQHSEEQRQQPGNSHSNRSKGKDGFGDSTQGLYGRSYLEEKALRIER